MEDKPHLTPVEGELRVYKGKFDPRYKMKCASVLKEDDDNYDYYETFTAAEVDEIRTQLTEAGDDFLAVVNGLMVHWNCSETTLIALLPQGE